MNKRIQELAEQAGLTKILNEHAHEFGNGQFENTQYPELSKFAELIVRECAGIYEKIDNGNLHMNTDDYLEALHRTFRS